MQGARRKQGRQRKRTPPVPDADGGQETEETRYWQYVTCDVATGVPHRNGHGPSRHRGVHCRLLPVSREYRHATPGALVQAHPQVKEPPRCESCTPLLSTRRRWRGVLTDVGRVWGEVDTLLGHRHRDRRSLEELMDNAVEHSGNSGGRVTVLRDNSQVAAIVEDGGCGIHANMQAESEGRSVELGVSSQVGTSTGAGQRGGGLWLVLTATAIVPDLTVHLHTGRTSYTASHGRGASDRQRGPSTRVF